MNQKEFDSLNTRRRQSMLTLIWPEVKKRLREGQSPTVIASQMSAEGYRGFNSSRIGVLDIHRLWELAVQSGEELATPANKETVGDQLGKWSHQN